MARGWESKSVELQQSDLVIGRLRRSPGAQLTPEQLAREREIDGLRSSVTRVAADLARATHPRHRAQLQAALAFLEDKIHKLTEPEPAR
jgi:hypothetical protein